MIVAPIWTLRSAKTLDEWWQGYLEQELGIAFYRTDDGDTDAVGHRFVTDDEPGSLMLQVRRLSPRGFTVELSAVGEVDVEPVESSRLRNAARRALAQGHVRRREAGAHANAGGRALSVRAQGRASAGVDDVLALRTAIVERSTRILGADTEGVSHARALLGAALSDAGRLDDAVEHGETAVRSLETVAGAADPRTCWATSILALSLRAAGRPVEAAVLARDAWQKLVEALGAGHYDVAVVQSRMASCLLAAGEIHPAVEAARHAERSLERTAESSDPEPVMARAVLASSLRAAAAYSQAVELAADAHQRMARILGPDHRQTLLAAGVAANCLWSSGDRSAGRARDLAILQDRTRVLGERHPDTIVARSHVTFDQWRRNTPLTSIVTLLEDAEDVLGRAHPDTLVIRLNYGLALLAEGSSGGLGLLESVLDDRVLVLGAQHPATADAKFFVADAYWKQGAVIEARELIQEVTDTRRDIFGPDHPESRGAEQTLRRFLSPAGTEAGLPSR